MPLPTGVVRVCQSCSCQKQAPQWIVFWEPVYPLHAKITAVVQDRLECEIWEARSTHYVRWPTKCKWVNNLFRIEDLQTADVAMKKQEEVKREGEVKSEFVQSLEKNAFFTQWATVIISIVVVHSDHVTWHCNNGPGSLSTGNWALSSWRSCECSLHNEDCLKRIPRCQRLLN